MKSEILLCSDKAWGRDFSFSKDFLELFEVRQLKNTSELTSLLAETSAPRWIFFAFWSSYVPKEVYSNHRAVIFHMTDLPYGRGGSPLQNLILGGKSDTKLSAIVCEEKLDAGDIYLQRPLDLSGSAQEIYCRAALLMPEMIQEIVTSNITPLPQIGEPVLFSRRTPAESEVPKGIELEKLYDFIRMLDADGYPKAFIAHGDLRIELSGAQLIGEALTAKIQVRRSGS